MKKGHVGKMFRFKEHEDKLKTENIHITISLLLLDTLEVVTCCVNLPAIDSLIFSKSMQGPFRVR